MKKLQHIFTLICTLLIVVITDAQTWIEKDSLPSGNGLLRPFSFVINGKLYVGGGYTGTISLSTFFEYDPSANVWTQKASIPTGLYACGSFALNGKGYVATGSLPGPSRLVYSYDPTTDSWTQKANFPGTARENGVGFSFNGKGYLFGGFIGGSSIINDMWQFNDSNNIWTQMANVPGPDRNGPMYFVVNNNAYVGMGSNVDGTAYYSDLYIFNPDSNTYTPVANCPEARTTGASFTIGNYGYMGLGTNLTGLLNDFYKYDPVSNTWTQVGNFGGVARSHGYSEIIGGIPYVGCGSNNISNTGGTYMSDLWSYGYPAGVENTVTNTSKGILCYPSPASVGFTIDMSGFEIGEKQITVYNQIGQIVYQTQSFQNIFTINNKFAFGLYTIAVKQGTRQEYAKVVIE